MTRFNTIIIANRGEVAVRVITTARALGYRTVAVFSDADARAPHVALADEAVRIGPGPASQSYLSIPALVQAAQRTGAQAVHPGYGFLSENAAFVRACEAAGLTFIGPSAEAVETMGNKAAAKRLMIEAGVPCVPGYQGSDQDEATLAREAERIGYPVMIKAAAGGGGRGMRVVDSSATFAAACAAARSEAESAFGSGELILERAVMRARHVEVQVFGDRHGNIVHLGERDCSVQRRHQKVIEEAPCPAVTAQMREALGEAAVAAAKAIGYVGAGTVEFLLDEDGAFYFLEMNTRIQVEHPVTEMISGQDLVAWQIDVAAGKPLPLAQSQIRLQGHAIEARLYAEDPAQDFLPQTGAIMRWTVPQGDGVRVDAGVESGQEMSAFYDPMVAKIIAHGRDREEARRRLTRALRDCALLGVGTNKAFLLRVLDEPTFAAGETTTGFVTSLVGGATKPVDPLARALAAVLLAGGEPGTSGWWTAGEARHTIRLRHVGDQMIVRVLFQGGASHVEADGASLTLSLLELHEATGLVRFEHDDCRRSARFARYGDGVFLDLGDGAESFERIALSQARLKAEEEGGELFASMNGVVVAVDASAGEVVARGQRLLVIEAMKMHHEVLSPIDGTLSEMRVSVGMQVATQQVLAVVDAAEAAVSQ